MQRWPSGHAVIERRSDLDDTIVLDVKVQVAADSAVGADGTGDGLLFFIPDACSTEVVLALEHQGAGRANAYAVTAVDASRLVERHIELGGDWASKPRPATAMAKVFCASSPQASTHL